MSGQFEEFGAALTAVTMGIDAFERANNLENGLLDAEGLVPIYLGQDLIGPRTYSDWWSVDADLDALQEQVAGLGSKSRQVFATAMLRSLKSAVLLFAGGSPSFEAKVRDLVGATTGPVDEAIIDGIRDELDTLLRRQGIIRGSLARRIAAWEESNALAPEALEGTYRELMIEGQRRTADRIFDTGDFSMALNPVRDVPYTARCSFAEGKMDLNVDIGFTRAAIKHLVAHEVFPGHATQLLYTRSRVLEGRAFPEVMLCTANTVLGCVQEGIADDGVHLIDWIEDDKDTIHLELRRLRSAAQTSAAWFLMADGWEADAVSEYLRDVAAGQEAWIKGRLRMAAHPFRGPFIASYWCGAQSVRHVRQKLAPGDFPEFVEYLYANAHSPESLEMFEPSRT